MKLKYNPVVKSVFQVFLFLQTHPKPMSTVTTTSLLSPPFPAPRFTTPAATSRLPCSFLPLKFTCITISRSRRSKPFLVRVEDGEGNAGGDDYDMNEDEAEEVDNKIRDLEGAGGGPDDDTAVDGVQRKSFMSIKGWALEDMVVDYPINEYEDELHKISSLDSDIFIRENPDPFTMYKSASGMRRRRRSNPFLVQVDDGGGDAGGDDYDMDEDEAEEVGNKRDFEVEYDPLKEGAGGGPDDDIAIDGVQSTSFMSIQGWDSDMVVDYRINEDEFHKISLLDCDFFIRKPPDPDNDVFDFREMYVTPPDTDVYSIPRVLAPMPQKYIRCAVSDYGGYNVTEPPIDAPRDPMYKTEREVAKVFLTKHYRNRRLGDPEFVLDFEEIYVIDSKTKSITRAKVIVTVPGGTDRDRKDDMLIIRDSGNSFKVINSSQRDDPTSVIESEEWDKSRYEMERHLSKLRDFSISNWF